MEFVFIQSQTNFQSVDNQSNGAFADSVSLVYLQAIWYISAVHRMRILVLRNLNQFGNSGITAE